MINQHYICFVDIYPKITSKPTVTAGTKNNRLAFTCEFESPDNRNDVVFEVTWFMGAPAMKIKTEELTGATRTSIFRNTNAANKPPTFYLGTTVSIKN